MSYIDQLDLIFGPITEGKILDEVVELYKSLHEYLGFSVSQTKSGIAAMPASGSFETSKYLTTDELAKKWAKEGWKPLKPISQSVNSISTHGSSMGSYVGTIKDFRAVWGMTLPIKGQSSFHSSLLSKLESALADSDLDMTAKDAIELYWEELLPDEGDIIIALFQRSFGRVDVAVDKIISDLTALKTKQGRLGKPTIYDLIGEEPPPNPTSISDLVDQLVDTDGKSKAQSILSRIVASLEAKINQLVDLQNSREQKDQREFKSLAKKAQEEFGTDIHTIMSNTVELGDKYAEAELQLAESVIKYW